MEIYATKNQEWWIHWNVLPRQRKNITLLVSAVWLLINAFWAFTIFSHAISSFRKKKTVTSVPCEFLFSLILSVLHLLLQIHHMT